VLSIGKLAFTAYPTPAEFSNFPQHCDPLPQSSRATLRKNRCDPNTAKAPVMSSLSDFVQFEGHQSLAQRLVLSTLTGRPVFISKIRSSSPTETGLAPHEVTLVHLLHSVTNGSKVDVSLSGAKIAYQPGLITGAKPGYGATIDGVIEQEIPATCRRGITYFLLPLCLLAPFSQAHMNVRFSGPGVITSATEAGDISVDTFRTAILPLFALFGIPTIRIQLTVLQRACEGPKGRGGGGKVELRFEGQVRLPKTLHLHRRAGRVKKIRGVAYCTGVSPANSSRMIHAARGVLNPFVSDVHIASQCDEAPLRHMGDKNPEKKRTGIGFGLSLVAETTASGVFYSADIAAPAEGGGVPEDIGKNCAYQLLEVIEQGGCASSIAAPTVLTLMAMGSEDVGRLRIGKKVLGSIEMFELARDLGKFGASSWGLREVDEDGDSGDMIVTVKGTGVGNVGKKIS
jgi:RNA 3'-terminal phosphate cyclase-like protein